MNWNSWAILYEKLCIFQVSAKYMCNSHRVLQSRCWAQLNFYVPLWMSLNKKNLSNISKNYCYKSYSNKIIKEKRWRTSKCKTADHQSVISIQRRSQLGGHLSTSYMFYAENVPLFFPHSYNYEQDTLFILIWSELSPVDTRVHHKKRPQEVCLLLCCSLER